MAKYFSQRYLILIVLAMSAMLVTGCQGCRDEKTAEEKKQEEEEKKEREKPTYETESAVIYPGQYSESVKYNRTKRGHWVTVDFRITANKFDTQGELQSTSCTGTVPARPVVVESTDYYAVSSRPFSIPRGELRNLETNLYIPRREGRTAANIKFDLFRSTGSLALFSVIHGTTTMSPHQYHMVVLSNRPDAYQYLNLIDSVSVPESSETGARIPKFYTVMRTRPSDEPIALPRQALYWTTIAYLIWDDLNIDQLDAEQQQALIDWIHFGGQLILSGPDCLDKLSDSFLADYLPAGIRRTKNLNADDFQEINENWAVKIKNQERKTEVDGLGRITDSGS